MVNPALIAVFGTVGSMIIFKMIHNIIDNLLTTVLFIMSWIVFDKENNYQGMTSLTKCLLALAITETIYFLTSWCNCCNCALGPSSQVVSRNNTKGQPVSLSFYSADTLFKSVTSLAVFVSAICFTVYYTKTVHLDTTKDFLIVYWSIFGVRICLTLLNFILLMPCFCGILCCSACSLAMDE